MEWIKKYAHTLAIITAIFISSLFMNGKIEELRREIHEIKKELCIIKTAFKQIKNLEN